MCFTLPRFIVVSPVGNRHCKRSWIVLSLSQRSTCKIVQEGCLMAPFFCCGPYLVYLRLNVKTFSGGSKMKVCPRVKNLIASWDFKDGYLSIARMRCRQWDCPYCAVKNADMWRGHLLRTFCEDLADEKWIFVTLTLAPWQHKMPFADGLKCLKGAWSNLYDRLRYKNGGRLKYVLVFETHKSGVFHAHALCNMGQAYDVYTVWDWNIERSHTERIADEKMHGLCVWLQKQTIGQGIGSVCHITRIREGETGKDNARLASWLHHKVLL